MNRPSEASLEIEVTQQFRSYLDLCAQYETPPSVRGYINFMVESYAEVVL